MAADNYEIKKELTELSDKNKELWRYL